MVQGIAAGGGESLLQRLVMLLLCCSGTKDGLFSIEANICIRSEGCLFAFAVRRLSIVPVLVEGGMMHHNSKERAQ